MARGYGIGISYPEQIYTPRTCLIRAVSLAPGKYITIPILTFVIDSIVVSMTQGTLNIWFGDYSGDNLPLVPHLHYNSIGEPNQLWVPGLGKGVYTITIAAEGNLDPCLGTVIL